MTGKILITGASGQLGRELLKRLKDRAHGVTRGELDLAKVKTVREAIMRMKPAAVVNAAAYTAVDRAEEEPQLCRAVNVHAVGQMALACRDLEIPLVQVSTDYVFTTLGKKRLPWREGDKPYPLGVYADSKWRGEVEAAGARQNLVIRTCGLYAPAAHAEARNFVNTMLRFAQAERSLRVVNDQFCTPTYVPHLAAAIEFLLESALAGQAKWGTYHVTNRGATTWFEFAQAIMEISGMKSPVAPITTAEYGAAAPRPAYSVLDCGKYQALAGPEMPSWREALEERLR